MYFPRLYPDELLYSAIARCRVHLGVGSHKVLVKMLFGDSNVAAITDLPSHLSALASNTGVSAAGLVENHTLFPLYAPFIPNKRRHELYQAMLASNRPTIGLAGATTALVKWPEWLRYCPACFEEMAARFGEPYWRRGWQIQGVEVCAEHGCQLLDSPVPFRRAQRHEFHAASPLFLPRGNSEMPAREDAVRLAVAMEQLLAYEAERSPGYERWTNFYRHLATECGARRGRQVRAEVIWERLLASCRRDWLAANGLWAPSGPPPWLLAMFRRHRKAFSALQHLVVWTSLRPGQGAGEMIRAANACQSDISAGQPTQQLPADFGKNQRYRTLWRVALEEYGGAKAARENGGEAYYAWLYRHDRDWLVAANKARHKQQSNNSRIDWRERDKALVRLLVKVNQDAEEDLSLPRKSRNWFLCQLPHRASVERHLEQLPLCRAFLERYTESVGEYQIRRLTRVMLEDAKAGVRSKRWELERRCGLEQSKVTPLAAEVIRLIGGWIE